MGVGGGLIFVPILDYFLIKSGVLSEDLVPYTLANSFFAILVSGIVGSFPAFRSKVINISHLFLVGFSGIVTILITSYLISIGTWYSPSVFKLVFCVLLLLTFIKTMMHLETEGSEKLGIGPALLTGAITGAVSGLSGLGGGIVMVPLFMMFGHIPIRKASILSFAIIPVLALPNIVYYAFQQPSHSLAGSMGYIVWPIVLPMIIGVLITVKAGVNTANRMSPKTIKFIFAAFIVITMVRILTTMF